MTERQAAGPWTETLEGVLASTLPAFLPAQRWFAGKARRIAAASIVDTAVLPEDPGTALVVVRVDYDEPPAETYALIVRTVSATASTAANLAGGLAVEASTESSVWKAMMHGFRELRDIPTSRGGSIRFGDTGGGPLSLDSVPLAAIRPLGKEQSNTSIRIGDRHVVKLFRKLEIGEHPELEIGRFLMRNTSFRAFPALRGSILYVPARGAAIALAVLQDFVASQGDGWTHVLDALEAAAQASTPPHTMIEELEQLGRVTGEFHAALATPANDPDFDPEPVGPADRERWQSSLAERATRTFALLERRKGALPDRARTLVEGVVRAWAKHAGFQPPALTGQGGFDKIRVHGDYHLGQTLATPAGFVLMDFEGEPARPLDERRAKHCAVKDVAGMLRSFDYAIETTKNRVGEGARGFLGSGDAAGALCAAFLDGYQAATFARGAGFLPADRNALSGWIDFFELDKALYEIEYELAQRPDWLAIPLAGVHRILTRARG